MTTSDLTAADVRSLFDYQPDTGHLIWRVSVAKAKRGAVAGGPDSSGYIKIGVRGRDYRAQRLVWLHVHGEWPAGQVDHIDGNPANNVLSNLRVVEQSTNQENQRRPHANNSHGFMGASRIGQRWQARIKVGAERLYLGLFDTAEQAHAAYLDAKRRLHAGCTI